MEVETDVAVVGGGPAGSIAALTLARAGVRVAIVDAGDGSSPRVGETVPPRFHREISSLVEWTEAARELAVPAYGNRSAWGSAEPDAQSFVARPHGHGLQLDRPRFDEFLLERATDAGALVLRETEIRSVTHEHGGRVTLASMATRIHAGALVDATGRGALLARQLGARRQLHDRMVAVVARHHGCRSDDEDYTQVESVRDGWWYTAPQPDGGFVVAWMTDTDLVGSRTQLAARWPRHIEAAPLTRARVEHGTPQGAPEIRSAAIQRCRSTKTWVPWVAVGDAALAVDPLSTSGIVRALGSGRDGALALLRAIDGDRGPLDAYEHGLDEELREHLELRARYYALEQRFRNAPFWHRRHPNVVVR
jgi:flavin-dependent dehydrogenase